ncbi:ROK family protein [Nesterenkonia xinjiangensis]|uniref:Putative NBD/HSP70 family sugar kinase n=1 Tax=Nesterenkonia xinjiangensis TaxID=225327 RepID=A0A7Z0K8X3_9MICC|nr:putative NBD/HSP70 family sugar kinase [Nesterenkonia xinjiangensis]
MNDVSELQAIAGQASQRTVNARRLLDVAWTGEPLTATEFMEKTGLTRATVLSVCRELVEAGWFQKVADARAAGRYAKGRPALRHAFRPDVALVVACDADEDLFTVAVADLHGVELTRVSRDVSAMRGALDRRQTLERLVDEALEEADVASGRIAAVVIGVPAPVDPEGESPPPDDAEDYWPAMNPGLATLFEERGWTVRLDNDANLGALCEASDGMGVGVRSFATLLSAERFGAGIVVDGRLLRGTRGGVGEMRVLDMVMGVEAPHGLARRARWELRRLAREGELTGELAELPEDERGAEAVFSAAERGDATALQVVDALAGRLAPVVQLLSGLLDLDRIIIAGAFASSAEPVLRRTREILSRNPTQRWAELVPSQHGADVVLRGAISAAIADVRDGALLESSADG